MVRWDAWEWIFCCFLIREVVCWRYWRVELEIDDAHVELLGEVFSLFLWVLDMNSNFFRRFPPCSSSLSNLDSFDCTLEFSSLDSPYLIPVRKTISNSRSNLFFSGVLTNDWFKFDACLATC